MSASAGVVLNGRYLPPPEDKDGKLGVRTTVLIHADAEALYRMWRDVEAAPLWQEQVKEVTVTGGKTSHWVMQSRPKSKDKTIEWDSEILMDEPGRRIAWRSIGGDSDNAGEVVFEPSPGGRGDDGHRATRVQGVDFTSLIGRAENQHTRVEERRVACAASVFRRDDSHEILVHNN